MDTSFKSLIYSMKWSSVKTGITDFLVIPVPDVAKSVSRPEVVITSYHHRCPSSTRGLVWSLVLLPLLVPQLLG